MNLDLTAGVEAMLGDGPTCDLREFVVEYSGDDNIWWMIGCGHHMNLFDAALERIEELESALRERERGTPPDEDRGPQGVDHLAGETPHRPA